MLRAAGGTVSAVCLKGATNVSLKLTLFHFLVVAHELSAVTPVFEKSQCPRMVQETSKNID